MYVQSKNNVLNFIRKIKKFILGEARRDSTIFRIKCEKQFRR